MNKNRMKNIDKNCDKNMHIIKEIIESVEEIHVAYIKFLLRCNIFSCNLLKNQKNFKKNIIYKSKSER